MTDQTTFACKALSVLLAAVLTAGLMPVLPAHAAEASSDTAEAPNEVAPLAAATSGSCGANATWSYAGGTLTITGKGAISNPAGFAGWGSSVTKVVLGEGITAIGEGSFRGFSNLSTVQLPSSLLTIGNGAFSRCSALTSVTLPGKLAEIGEFAFERTRLTSLSLPASVTKVSAKSFYWTQDMGSISVAQGSKSYKTINGVLCTADGKVAVYCPPAKTGTVTMPSSVTKIADYAFLQTELTTVNMPSTVDDIGERAFYLARITSVTIPDSVKYLMNFQFANCMNLKSVKMGSGLCQVSTGDFQGCDSLTDVDLGNVAYVQSYAFEKCPSLAKVTIPKTVLRIDDAAFPETTTVALSQGSGLTKLENGAYMRVGQVPLNVKECYSQAFSMLELVNAERAKNGVAPLTMDKDLVDAAMIRAAECALVLDTRSHYRPCALLWNTISSKADSENIATTPSGTQAAFDLWMASKEGHRENMLAKSHKSVGIGCVSIGGTQFWVQVFGDDDASPAASKSEYKDVSKTRVINVAPAKDFYKPEVTFSNTNLRLGQTAKVSCVWSNDGMKLPIPSTSLLYASSNEKVATVSADGTIKAVGTGTATVKAYFKGLEDEAVTKTITVTKVQALAGAAVSLSQSSFTYDGKAKKPGVTVKLSGKTLKNGTDYAVSYKNNVKPGTATVTVTGKGGYTGTLTKTYKITKASIAKASVSVSSTLPYSGKALKPGVTVKLGGKTLKAGTDYAVSYKNNVGSSKANSTSKATVTVTGKGSYSGSVSKTFQIKNPSIQYSVHRQTYGWEKEYSKRDGVSSGTTGQSKRLEGIKIRLANKPVSGSLQYRTHVQKIGWQGWKSEGQMSGTTGKSYRLEAIQVKLTGEMAKKYDVYYRVHAQRFGWMGWAKNGAQAGTAGYGYRLESIQIKLVPKGAAAPTSADGVPSTKGKAAFSQKK